MLLCSQLTRCLNLNTMKSRNTMEQMRGLFLDRVHVLDLLMVNEQHFQRQFVKAIVDCNSKQCAKSYLHPQACRQPTCYQARERALMLLSFYFWSTLITDLWSRYRARRRQRRRVLLSMSRGPSSSGRPPCDMTLRIWPVPRPAYLCPHTPIHLIAVLQCIVFFSLCPIFHSAMTCICALSQRKNIFREKTSLP